MLCALTVWLICYLHRWCNSDFATARTSQSGLTLGQSPHRLLIVKLDLTSLYSSKTDDELLALAVERHSLEPEAESALWAELKRRKLTDPSLRHHSMPDELPFAKTESRLQRSG